MPGHDPFRDKHSRQDRRTPAIQNQNKEEEKT